MKHFFSGRTKDYSTWKLLQPGDMFINTSNNFSLEQGLVISVDFKSSVFPPTTAITFLQNGSIYHVSHGNQHTVKIIRLI